MRISDWSSDVCSSDLRLRGGREEAERDARQAGRIHVMDPEPETEEAGADGGQHDPGIAVDRTLREGRHDHRHHRDGGQEDDVDLRVAERSEEHTSELQSLMRISYAVFCLKKKNKQKSARATLVVYE